jgi:hypothetical protein
MIDLRLILGAREEELIPRMIPKIKSTDDDGFLDMDEGKSADSVPDTEGLKEASLGDPRSIGSRI